MPGKSKQAKAKRDKHAVDMSVSPPDPPKWAPPPLDECDDVDLAAFAPPNAVVGEERIKVRLRTRAGTDAIVQFAVVQQTRHRGKWRDVAVADSTHGDEVHVHRYGRVQGDRVGPPEIILPIVGEADVARGYDLAYDSIVTRWHDNKVRWNDG